jgi:hypothetical protein
MNPARTSSKKPPWFRAPVLMYLTIVIVFAILAVYVFHSVVTLSALH